MWYGIRKIVNIGGTIVDDDKEVATNFNRLFVNVCPTTEKTIPKVLKSRHLNI